MGNTQKGMSDLFVAGSSQNRFTAQGQEQSILASTGHIPLHTTTGATGSSAKQGIAGHRYGEHSNQRYNTQTHQETHNSSHSFAARLTDSQLVINDPDDENAASSQKYKHTQPNKYKLSGFDSSLYKECDHSKGLGDQMCANCERGDYDPLGNSSGRVKTQPNRERAGISMAFDPKPDFKKKISEINTQKHIRGQPINPGKRKKIVPHLEDFDIIRVIGKGGFSTVFQVRRKDDGAIYAMKCLKKSQIKRENKVRHVMNERQILQNVDHPYIVKMKWAFQSEHYLFIILEFCAGGEIFYHMNKVLRFSEKVAKFYFAEIVLAMEYLHAKNIFYRDLKPENVLLDQDGHVKLADFGISRLNFGEKERSSSFCGSPEYMSPEMLKASRIHGRSVDYYALGALLYEMLTGLPPNFSENRDEMYRKILHNTPEYPRYLSPMAKSILKGLLIKNPEQRLGAKYGIQEIKDHPFCMDINWEDALQNLPVRFTFEEDFVKSHHTRRKSDPCIELGAYSTPHKNLDSPGLPSGLGDYQQVFNNLGQAIVYPSFVHERGQFDNHTNKTPSSFKVSAHKNQFGYSDEIGDGSPNYSRPPSSTFRGYSFMNFRNDSISSAEQNTQEGINKQSNHQSPDNQKLPFSKPHPSQPISQFQHSHQASQQFVTTQPQLGVLNCQNLQNATHLKQQMSMSGPGVFNIIDDYQFTTSQRSRTISFANQSIMTEGVEQQKNVYSMQFKGFNNFFNEIQFKANEYEFNAFNHKFPKKWQMPANIVSKLRLDPKSLQQIIQNQSMLPPPVAQLTEQVLIQEAINNFDYRNDDPQHQRGQSYQWPNIVRNMPDIIEDIENEARYAESPRNLSHYHPLIDSNNITSVLYTNPHSVLLESKQPTDLLGRNSNDSLNEKVTQILQGDKEAQLDQFTKNLIRFNDEINNVKTERKRKPIPNKNKIASNQGPSTTQQQNENQPQQQDLDRRKGAQSLYTNLNPINVDNRIRIQSNYTTLSGERLAEVTEVGSIRSGRKSNLKNQQISQTQFAQSIISSSQSPPKKLSTKEPIAAKGKSKANTMYGPNDQKQFLDKIDNTIKSPILADNSYKQTNSRQMTGKNGTTQAFSPKTIGAKPSLAQSTSEQKYSSLMAQSIQNSLTSPKQNIRIGSGQNSQFGDKKTSTPSNSANMNKQKFIVNNQMSLQNTSQFKNQVNTQNVKSRNSASSQHLHNSVQNPASQLFISDKNISQQQNNSLLSLSIQNQNSISGAKLKNTKLEQIDEFDMGLLSKQHELSSSTVKIPHKQTLLSQQITQDLSKPRKKISRLNSPKNEILSAQKLASTTKGGGIQLYQNSNNKLSVPHSMGLSITPNQTNRNRQKTSSQYVSNSSIGSNQFKGFFNTQDFHKVTQDIKAYDSNPSQTKQTEDDIQSSQIIDKTNKMPLSKNTSQIKTIYKIPKSLEREAKVNGSSDDNTLEDVDENMDEFGANDNQNIQRLKNVSLITSIALTNGKQLDFGGITKDQYSSTFVRNSNFSASSSIISQSMHPPFHTQSNQGTPDEMNLHNLRESANNLLNYHQSSKPLKTSPQQYLGDSSFLKEDDGVPQTEIYDSPKNSSLNLPNMSELENYHTKQSNGAQVNSSLLVGSGGAASLAGYHSVNVHFASLLQSNGGGSVVLSPKLPGQINRKQQTTYAQHSTPMGHQHSNRVDSPKPTVTKQNIQSTLPPSSKYHAKDNSKKLSKSDNKYQFWNTKRNDQKSPSQNLIQNKDCSQQQLDQSVKTPKTSDLYSAFEEVKNSVTERAETEVKISDDKEKMLLSKSERKLKQNHKSNMGPLNSSQFNSSHSRNSQTASNSLNSNQNQKPQTNINQKASQLNQPQSPENHINFHHQYLHTHSEQASNQLQFNSSSDNQVRQQLNNQKSQNSNSLSLRLTLSQASKNL